MKRLTIIWTSIFVIAIVMSGLGSLIFSLFTGKGKLGFFGFASASCVTWAILGWRVRSRSVIETIVIGLISPVVGALVMGLRGSVMALLHTPTMTTAETLSRQPAFLGLWMLGAFSMMLVTAWVTFPLGVATAFSIRWVWDMLPPNHPARAGGGQEESND